MFRQAQHDKICKVDTLMIYSLATDDMQNCVLMICKVHTLMIYTLCVIANTASPTGSRFPRKRGKCLCNRQKGRAVLTGWRVCDGEGLKSIYKNSSNNTPLTHYMGALPNGEPINRKLAKNGLQLIKKFALNSKRR